MCKAHVCATKKFDFWRLPEVHSLRRNTQVRSWALTLRAAACDECAACQLTRARVRARDVCV